MIKRYFEHMHQKSTHERRQHAMRVATVVTALVFVGWLGTLGLRLGTAGAVDNNQNGQNGQNQNQLANVISGEYTPVGNSLEVATTSTQY